MSFQAYLDAIKEKTGKSPQEFISMAHKQGLSTHKELLEWLTTDYGLGTGYARAMIKVIQDSSAPKTSKDEKVGQHFTGKKAVWGETFDNLMKSVNAFGDDIYLAPVKTYISLVHGKQKKFGMVQVTEKAFDIGIKRKGVAPEGRFEAAGDWNSMMTHRVRITDPKQVDDEVIAWLHEAYKNA